MGFSGMNERELLVLAAIIVLVLFDLAAIRWGADSRHYDRRRNWW